MNKALNIIGGLGLGAGLMYVFDPERGGRRRAMMRDKVTRAVHKTGDAIDTTARDLKNRTVGLVAEVGSLIKEDDATDDVIVERVRSKMGRLVSHPHSINVTAQDGRVTLSGPILESEVSNLLKCVSSVRGVRDVENRLEVHKQADDVPGLQGGVERPGARFELMQANWSPATRLMIGITGVALISYCARRKDAPGASLGTIGFGLLLRAITNTEMKRMIGLGGGRRTSDTDEATSHDTPVNADERDKQASKAAQAHK
jgi:uncharacterized protein YwbE